MSCAVAVATVHAIGCVNGKCVKRWESWKVLIDFCHVAAVQVDEASFVGYNISLTKLGGLDCFS